MLTASSLSSFLKRPIVMVILIGLAIRLVVAPLITFSNDMAYWMLIVSTEEGGMGLYDTTSYHYTPPWGYVMAAVGAVCSLLGITDLGTFAEELLPYTGGEFVVLDAVPSIAFSFLIKIPLIIVDLLVALLLHRFVCSRTGDDRKAVVASALWFLSPLVIVESSMHVMFDNMAALAIIVCFLLLLDRRYALAGAAFSLSVLIKFFPVFLVFLLIALVLKREGVDRHGAACVGRAFVGAVAAFVLIEIPSILAGDFWQSLYFIISRLGFTVYGVGEIMTVPVIVAAVMALVALVAAIWYAERSRGTLSRIASEAGTERFHRSVRRGLLAVFVLALVVVVAYSFVSVGGTTASELFTSFGMRFVTVMSVLSLLIEFYLAYRLLFLGDSSEKRVATVVMLSVAAIFLWPPAPQYVLLIVPFVAVYAAMHMPALSRPLLMFSAAFAVYDIMMSNASALFSLAEYTGWISMDSLIPVVEFMCSYIGPIPMVGVVMAVFGIISYISMLYIPYTWYRAREVLHEES